MFHVLYMITDSGVEYYSIYDTFICTFPIMLCTGHLNCSTYDQTHDYMNVAMYV